MTTAALTASAAPAKVANTPSPRLFTTVPPAASTGLAREPVVLLTRAPPPALPPAARAARSIPPDPSPRSSPSELSPCCSVRVAGRQQCSPLPTGRVDRWAKAWRTRRQSVDGWPSCRHHTRRRARPACSVCVAIAAERWLTRKERRLTSVRRHPVERSPLAIDPTQYPDFTAPSPRANWLEGCPQSAGMGHARSAHLASSGCRSGTTPIRTYTGPSVLVIDDVGITPIRPQPGQRLLPSRQPARREPLSHDRHHEQGPAVVGRAVRR